MVEARAIWNKEHRTEQKAAHQSAEMDQRMQQVIKERRMGQVG